MFYLSHYFLASRMELTTRSSGSRPREETKDTRAERREAKVSETRGTRYLKKRKKKKGKQGTSSGTRYKPKIKSRGERSRAVSSSAEGPRGQPRVTTSRASEKETLLPDCDQFRRRCAPCAQQCADVRVRGRCALEYLMRPRLRHPLPRLCRISPRARVAHVRRQRDRHMYVARIHAHGCGSARPPPRWLVARGDIQMIKSIIGQWRRKPTLWISRYA